MMYGFLVDSRWRRIICAEFFTISTVARMEYAALHRQSAAKLAKCDLDLQRRRAVLEAMHQSELDVFEARWNSEAFLRGYTKPSPQLLNMKAKEKSMVIARMFDQAKRMRTAAVGTEKLDTLERLRSALDDMQAERIRIIARHERESQTIATTTAQLREIAQREVGRNERPMLVTIARLERMVTDLEAGVIEREARPATVIVQTNGYELVSSRTAYKFAAYRAAAQGIKLNIQPLGDVVSAALSFRRARLALGGSRK
jgi:hypothetical protein